MSHQQHHYGNRSYGGDSYAGGAERGGRGDQRNHYGRAGGGQGAGQGRSYGDQRGGGGRGRGGGRISGGRFWSGERRKIESEGIEVRTNCYQLAPVSNNSDNTNAVIHQYVVRIDSLVKKRDTPMIDSTYVPTTVEHLPNAATATLMPFYLVKNKELMNPEDDRSTILSRRVLNHCQHKLQEVAPYQSFIHDGTNIAYSRNRLDPVPNKKLYTRYLETFEYRDIAQSYDSIQDEKTGMQISKKQKKLDDVVEYIVSIPVNSDDDDADTTVRKGWYIVSFQHTAILSMNVLAESKAMLPLVNCINTALRGNMISHCIGFGKSPYMYFFHPPKEQEAILPAFLKEKLYNSIIPLLGLKQSVRYCANSLYGLLLVADFGIRYMYNDVNAKTKEPFHVLQIDPHGNRQSATIANTIKIQNVHDCVPSNVRTELEKRLKKINFHIRYYKGGQYENKLRAQQRKQVMAKQENIVKAGLKENLGDVQRAPLTDEQIEKKKYFLKKNQRLFVSTEGEPSIIWDPNLYTFPYVPKDKKERESTSKLDYDSALADTSTAVERLITVEEYFFEQYQFTLKYPKMPLIRVKSRHKNMKEYYPLEFLLQCPDEVKNMNTDEQINDGLRVGDEFCGVKRIEKVSSLVQSTNSQYNPLQRFQEGQRDVLHTQFQLALRPEPITVQARVLEEPKLSNNSQSVVLTDGSLTLKGNFDAPSSMSTFALLNYTNENNQRLWDRCFKGLFQYCRQRGIKVSDDLDENTFRDIAVQKSLPRTLQDMSDHFQTAVNKAQKHFLANRRAVDVQNMSGIVMKCDVKLSESNPDQYVNVWPHGDGRMREGIPLNRVDCPSIVFIVLPDGAASQVYSNIKLLSHVDFAIQSQVMIWSKASKDNNTQYFSNMSFKLNLKLATALGREAAWRRSNDWIDEVPTLIIGISMASDSGQDSLMTVVGTALLDNVGLNHIQELCVQKKAPLIAEEAMTEIITSLGISWSQCNERQTPERVVIYRSTGDDGMFEDIIGTELKAIKSAFHELNKTLPSYNCSHCNNNSCVFCLPKITMVIAQSQHNIILAPTNTGVVNVPSGTCVEGLFPALSLSDDQKMSGLFESLNRHKNDQSNSFLFPASDDGSSTAFALVAHGGLKGTSKCVIYRVIWNENLFFMPKSSLRATQLTLSKIQRLTYHLSFQYGTAPKAPRLPTVLQYSVRLNKIAIGYVHFLHERGKSRGDGLDSDAVFTAILRRVRGTNLNSLERLTVPFHSTSMG